MNQAMPVPDRGLKMDTRRDNLESVPNQPTTVSTDDARQGVTGHNVRYVLGYSTAGVIVLFGLIFYFMR